MNIFKYEEVIEKIENTHRFGNKPGVEITAEMMNKLECPNKGIPFIHVAGTNGKGSTCAFLSSILKEAGLNVGTFTSPHLIDFEERIVVNGCMISKEDVRRIGNQILSIQYDVTPTYFDYCLAIAMVYFKEQKCDVMVIETGLGGALDSTNALGVPEVSVITKIGFDHMSILGNTLTQIASEKAGIIKRGSHVILENQEKEAYEVLLNRIKDEQITEYQEVSKRDIDYVKKLNLKIPGIHQYENASAAMLAAQRFLQAKGYNDEEIGKYVEAGLEEAGWPGRMEILCMAPFIMVDGAHNGHGVTALKSSLMDLYPDQKFDFYMAVMADKDYPNMIDEMLPLANSFTTVTLENERAAQAGELAKYIEQRGIKVNCVSDVKSLIGVLHGQKNNKNIVFGSLYFVGEVKQYFKNGGFLNEECTENIQV